MLCCCQDLSRLRVAESVLDNQLRAKGVIRDGLSQSIAAAILYPPEAASPSSMRDCLASSGRSGQSAIASRNSDQMRRFLRRLRRKALVFLCFGH